MIPYSELELRNQLELAFVSPTMEEYFPRSASIKGKRKNITQVPEQSKDNGLMNYEYFGNF